MLGAPEMYPWSPCYYCYFSFPDLRSVCVALPFVVVHPTGVIAFSGSGATRRRSSSSRRSIHLRASSCSCADIAADVPEGRRRRHPCPERDLSRKPRRLPSSSAAPSCCCLRQEAAEIAYSSTSTTLRPAPPPRLRPRPPRLRLLCTKGLSSA